MLGVTQSRKEGQAASEQLTLHDFNMWNSTTLIPSIIKANSYKQ